MTNAADALDMAAAAIGYARLGLRVFPCWPALVYAYGLICGCGKRACTSPAKHPIGRLVPNGVLDATSDEAQVAHFWAGRPDANIGMATGDLVVIDIDPRHGGDIGTLQAREPLPPTWRAATGGGGQHLFFSTTQSLRNTAGKLGTGIDTRGVGGYVVLAPSRHINGMRYVWELGPGQSPLAQLPDWIIEALTKTASSPRGRTDWRSLVTSEIPQGQRNDAIAKLCGHLLRHRIDPKVVLNLMLDFNTLHCCPPLPVHEVVAVVESIAGRELERRGIFA
jgi:hypothetical protein